MANQEQIRRLRCSVQEWNSWRQEHPEIQPDLSRTYLSRADLSHADLSHANFSRTYLSHADLSGTNLSGVHLNSVYFKDAIFTRTIFAWVDLSNTKGLETATHLGPSVLDINSVILPHDEPTRLHFLRDVGFTETQIDYLPSLLTPRPIQYQSLFISYASQDDAIARQLYADLRKKRCSLLVRSS